MINLSITLLFWCNIFSCAFSYRHITILCKDLVNITSHGRKYVTCAPGLNGTHKVQRHYYVFHVNLAFSYRSLFDWCYKGFLSGVCSSVSHPFLISLRGETRGFQRFPDLTPRWPPSCNYTGVNSHSVDQHTGAGPDRRRARRNS